MTFQPSPQQQTVFKFVTDGQGNAFVVAVAGAGKTTTILHAVERMTGTVAFVAYNKKIADEISAKLKARGTFDASKPWLPIAVGQAQAQAGTFHSFGFKIWRKMNPKVELNEKAKWDAILEGVDKIWHEFIVKLVGLAKDKALGVNNPRVGQYGDAADVREWYKVIQHHNLMEMLEEGMKVEDGVNLCQAALAKGIDLASELIDYADMIYMPILKCQNVPGYLTFDWILVDEAQDTNPARRALARLMKRRGTRYVFVGDPCQAIYGFTGADADSVQQIIRDFHCIELPLTVTYRCPKSVVKAAQAYVSHIQAHESAPEGVVTGFDRNTFDASYASLRPDDAILCRNTKPLVEMAYKLIRAKVACHVEGRDIGTGLIKLATKWKKFKTVGPYLDKLEEWSEARAKKFMDKGQETQAEAVMDKFETMKVLCEGKQTMDQVVAAINELFQDTEQGEVTNLTLSTVHKSKGREWHNVFVLGFAEYMPSKYAKQDWEREQERNLIYVAFTRAQEKLVLVG